MRSEAIVHIDAPIELVWAEAADFGSHDQWMSDAAALSFATRQTAGPGTTMLIRTRLGPLSTVDRLTIVEMQEPNLIRGVHTGPVTGEAQWTFEADGTGTVFKWREDLRFPWFFGGRLGEMVARPIFNRVWHHNLVRLKRRLEEAR